jgi:DNA invertase Pin-like site-specific DNA recombinase
MKAALYLRVSTVKRTLVKNAVTDEETEEYKQRPEIQERNLRRLCKQRGWTVAGVFTDRASGRKEDRPMLKTLMEDARRGKFDVVAVAAFDRFARSVKHLVTALEEFRTLGIQFVSLREAIDTSTPMGKAMFTIIGAMAELEASLISERTVNGLAYVREHGTRSGKGIGRPRRVLRRDEVVRLKREGFSVREIGKKLGAGHMTIYRLLQTPPDRVPKPPSHAA